MYEPIDDTDVSLLTQFTIKRFSIFERLVQAWDGPLHAVFYGNDQDVRDFEILWGKSTMSNSGDKVIIHVVYTREVSILILLYI